MATDVTAWAMLVSIAAAARFRERGPHVVEQGDDRGWWNRDGSVIGAYGLASPMMKDYRATSRVPGIEDKGLRPADPKLLRPGESGPPQRQVRRPLALQTNCHVSAVLLIPELQGDLDRAPVGFECLVQEQLAPLECLLYHCAHHRIAASSPSESGMCEDTRVASEIGPRAIASHRHEPFPLEVGRHVMFDLIEAACLPPTRTAFSTELIDRGGIVRPDEPDVRTAGSTELARPRASRSAR